MNGFVIHVKTDMKWMYMNIGMSGLNHMFKNYQVIVMLSNNVPTRGLRRVMKRI